MSLNFRRSIEAILEQLTVFEKPLEDIKPNRWITIEEQNSFCEFLKVLGINVNKLEWCASDWKKYRCSINHSHTKKISYIACGCRGICPRDSMSYASKRAHIMYQWIKQNLSDKIDFDLKLNQIVLTLPEYLHDMNTKLFSKMIKKFLQELKIEANGYCLHTRHTQHPLSYMYVPAHLLSIHMHSKNDGLVQRDYYVALEQMIVVW